MVLAANADGDPDHVTVPVYPLAEVTVGTGVAPIVGAVTPPIAATEIFWILLKTAVIVPELALLDTDVAPEMVKKLAGTPVKV